MNSDPRFYEAQQALGINNPNSAGEIKKINDYIFEQDIDNYKKDDDFIKAANTLVSQGEIEADSYKYHNEESYKAWAEKKGFDEERSKFYSDRMLKEHGENWYGTGVEGIKYDSSNLTAIQGQMEKDYYDSQTADQQAQLDKAYEQNKADSEAAAAQQQEFMKEMMNQPVYKAQQAMPIAVQKPQAKQEALLPAPAAPMPMNIAPPPAPELTQAANKMAIVRTPQSTKARQRRSTRGTSSLIN
jgi:hypothetical protein